jgi:hypothetical protein
MNNQLLFEILLALSAGWFGWLLICAIDLNKRLNDENK